MQRAVDLDEAFGDPEFELDRRGTARRDGRCEHILERRLAPGSEWDTPER